MSDCINISVFRIYQKKKSSSALKSAIVNISVNNIDIKNNYCNVGYVIMYDYWGNGYAAEALRAVSDYLLSERNYY